MTITTHKIVHDNDVRLLPTHLHAQEEEMLVYWDQIKAFETSLKQSEGKPEFTFYDG
jgi:isoleucyl-tRNA synthetase